MSPPSMQAGRLDAADGEQPESSVRPICDVSRGGGGPDEQRGVQLLKCFRFISDRNSVGISDNVIKMNYKCNT